LLADVLVSPALLLLLLLVVMLDVWLFLQGPPPPTREDVTRCSVVESEEDLIPALPRLNRERDETCGSERDPIPPPLVDTDLFD